MNSEKTQSGAPGQDGDKIKNGVVTVNDDKNPTPEERDQMIGAEKHTERVRSERESVQEAARSGK